MKVNIPVIIFSIAICSLFAVSCRGTAERQLVAAVEDYNRTCPIRMSDIIRIDSLHLDHASRDLAFCCTVTDLSRGVFSDTAALQTARDFCERESRTQIDKLQSNDYGRETLMLIKRAKTTLSFVYRLDSGDTIDVHTEKI